MHKFKLAIVIPTYNNASVLRAVVEDVKRHVSDELIIVVNDGSTDTTDQILQKISGIEVLSYSNNCGKGIALRRGFQKAFELGATNVITFDGDGQHLPEDLSLFIEKTTEKPETLFIGHRIIPYDKGVEPPSRSTVGKKFGNFWYKFITRISLSDTQCGFRSYPLSKVLAIHSKRKKYEYEQELLIKMAWNGVEIQELDIHIYYQPEEESMSHFRPVRDFIHISRVNSKYAFIRVVNPFLFLDVPGNSWREKIKALVKHELRGNTTPQKAALSVSVGVFFGLSPIHGFQVISSMGIALVCGLNKPLTFLGVSISSAPMLPFIIALEIAVGKIFVSQSLFTMETKLSKALYGGAVFGVGAIVIAVLGFILSYIILYPILRRMAIIRSEKNRRKKR